MSWAGVARWVLERSLPSDEAAAVLGDLLEEAHHTGARRRVLLDACAIAIRRAPRRTSLHHHDSHVRKHTPMETLAMDFRFAARSLAKRPSFTAVVLTTLALGIGAATAIFSIVEAILLRPLPFPGPERLVYANELDGGDRITFAWPNYVDWRDRSTSFERVACHSATSFTVIGDGRAQRLNGRLVCAPFFDVLGVQMAMGRNFAAADDEPGAPLTAVISDAMWHRDFGGDPQILGRTLKAAAGPATVIGVLPPGFKFSRPEDLFLPSGTMRGRNSHWHDRGNHVGLNAIGRLKPGVSVEQANGEMKRITDDLRREYPNSNARTGGQVVLLRDRLVDGVKDTLVALMGAVGFLLLLTCVNVANLLVARGAARQHELAIRTALGSSRWRLVRQLLAESTLLSLAGAALGVAAAAGLIKILVALAPAGTPRIEEVGVNTATLLFALAAAGACGVVFGAFPAVQVSGGRGGQLLARASRTSAAVAPRRTRRVLMAAEVALALVLLVGCGLMARTMWQLNSVDPGFRHDNLLTARVVLSGALTRDGAQIAMFGAQLVEKAAQLPGVESAAVTLSLPIEGSNWGSVFTVRDKPVPPRTEIPASAFVPVSAGYFRTMEMRIQSGREFEATDTANAAPVVVVNETFANRLWPGENAIGKYVKQGWPEWDEKMSPWRRVVGVVRDVKLNGVDRETPMQAYLPFSQNPSSSMALVLRTNVDPASLARSVESVVAQLNKEVPVTRVLPMSQLMRDAIARQRLSMVILAVFAGVAIILAAVGLYGVVSHGVTERTREIGVRMALGAERGTVVRLFVLHGVATAAVGTVIGLAGAYYLSKWVQALLFQVRPTDPATFAGVAILLLAVAALACYIPARRAARIDPLAALRTE